MTDPPVIPIAVWLALFPISFVLHFAEELLGGEGYPAYLYRVRGVRMSTRRFVLLQTVGFVLFAVAAVVSWRLGFPEFMIGVLSGFVLCNALTHTATAIANRGYGPGLVASLLLWLPLGAFSIFSLYGGMSNTRLAVAVVIGLAANGLVAVGTLLSDAEGRRASPGG